LSSKEKPVMTGNMESHHTPITTPEYPSPFEKSSSKKPNKEVEKLVLDHLWVSKNYANKAINYAKKVNPRIEFKDLYQSGVIGLIKAAISYKEDHPSNATFSTYALYHVRREVFDHGILPLLPFHTPRNTLRGLVLPQTPKEEETAALYPHVKRPLRSLNEEIPPFEDQGLFDPPPQLEEIIPTPEAESIPTETNHALLTAELEEAMEKLSPRLKKIIQDHYGIHTNSPKTLAEIGRELNFTREYIRILHNRAILKLKHAFKEERLQNLQSD